ncbi:MAG: molybdate ABC transporter substrate-binding protein [Pseudohongiellaceae bacterium]
MDRFAQVGVAIVCLFVSFGGFTELRAEQATIAVASNFSQAMEALVDHFEQDSSHSLQLVYGSSGRLYAQITNGAPFHAFLSADSVKPALLEENGVGVPGSQITYGIGRLALWSAGAVAPVESLDAIKQPTVDKVAIANPRLAPYGLASQQVLKSLELWETAPFRLVQGENIAQAYQFVYSGNADIGFVSLAQLIGSTHHASSSYWLIPAALHAPIVQDAVLLQRGRNNQAALSFMKFLRTDSAKEIIESYGYSAAAMKPEGDY